MQSDDFSVLLLHSEMTADHLIARYEQGVAEALECAYEGSASETSP